jgi:hypothetical protein
LENLWESFWGSGFGYEMLFRAAKTSPFDMPFSWRPDMCYIFVQMAFPMFHEFDADGTIRTNRLHWEGFPRLAWEALSAASYTTPPTYKVSEFERYGVPRCRVIVTVLPHPDHADWSDLSFVYWGFITNETVESAALRVLTDFCDHYLPLDEILVVCEYSDVFPDELPGMPTDRDVAFVIELQPGTTPIFQTTLPYASQRISRTEKTNSRSC